MRARRRILAVWAVLLAIAAGLLILAGIASILLDWFRRGIDAGPQQLVYHTNHAAVLQACRDVMKDPQGAGFPAAQNGVFSLNGLQSGARLPANFPTTLANLNFEFMTVEQNQVIIYFGGGFGHWGYSTAPPAGGANVQLIPGLWFWSEYGLPRDPSIPYYRTGELMFLGGIVAAWASIILMIYRRRNTHDVHKP